MRLVSRRPIFKNTQRGFATVELPIGPVIRDIPILLGRNGRWASLPAKPQLDHDGRQKLNGKAAYSAILEWRDRALSDRFNQVVTAAIRQMYPSALDGDLP
jgi:hypothetical protein